MARTHSRPLHYAVSSKETYRRWILPGSGQTVKISIPGSDRPDDPEIWLQRSFPGTVVVSSLSGRIHQARRRSSGLQCYSWQHNPGEVFPVNQERVLPACLWIHGHSRMHILRSLYHLPVIICATSHKNGYKNNTYTVPDFCDTIFLLREYCIERILRRIYYSGFPRCLIGTGEFLLLSILFI